MFLTEPAGFEPAISRLTTGRDEPGYATTPSWVGGTRAEGDRRSSHIVLLVRQAPSQFSFTTQCARWDSTRPAREGRRRAPARRAERGRVPAAAQPTTSGFGGPRSHPTELQPVEHGPGGTRTHHRDLARITDSPELTWPADTGLHHGAPKRVARIELATACLEGTRSPD